MSYRKDGKSGEYEAQDARNDANIPFGRPWRAEQVDQNRPLNDSDQEELCVSANSARDTVAVPYLLIAGARTDESDELIKMAESLAPGRVKILLDLPREQMPDFYRSLDVFVLTSLFEMMGIAVLEAMASGVPVVVNDHPVLRWKVGMEGKEVKGKREEARDEHPISNIQHPTPSAGGGCIDMEREGELARFLNSITPEWIEEHGRNARERAERMFSKEAVIPQILEMYEAVAGED